MNKSIIMSWGRCKIEVARVTSSQTFPNILVDVGTINEKSTVLSIEDVERLTSTATGSIIVAIEDGEPTVTLTTRVKEMDFDKESLFTGAKQVIDGELNVETNVVVGEFAFKLTPNNVGAIGIKARRSQVSFKSGSSEEEGDFVDLSFKILPCNDGEPYKKFRVKSKKITDFSMRAITSSSIELLSTKSSSKYLKFLN